MSEEEEGDRELAAAVLIPLGLFVLFVLLSILPEIWHGIQAWWHRF